MSPHTRGVLALVLTTLLWGATFALGKIAYAVLTPATLTGGRYLLAALLIAYRWPGVTKPELRHGFWLGIFQFACIAAVYQGLLTIEAGRSSFLVSTASIMVPVAGRILGRPIAIKVWIAAIGAILGIALMTDPGRGITTGDLWTLFSAAVFAIYIFLMERASELPSTARLTAVQTAVVGICSALWMAATGSFHTEAFESILSVWPIVLYLAISGVLTILLQGIGQRTVAAPEAAIIFTLEPVFATIIAWYSLGEKLTPLATAGAALVLIANAIAQWPTKAQEASASPKP
ncbi:MAG: DMT family transporter [Acidobacteria bacterium]|nr:DMT family transporter [Acidobacteriota bacterium]